MELKFYWLIFLYKSSSFRFSRPLAVVVVCFIQFVSYIMPKEKVDRWLIRNRRIRAENDFNRIMCEYVKHKYGEIATECAEFFDHLMDKYPAKNTKTYKGSKKYKAWVSKEIAEYTTKNAICKEPEASDIASGDEPEASDIASGDEPEASDIASGDEPEASDIASGDEPEASDIASGDEPEASDIASGDEPEASDIASGDNIINQALMLADNDIAEIIAELENAGVPLTENEDEGIQLDLYEELHGDIADFNVEVELNDNVFW